MENDGESLRGSHMVPSSPGLLRLLLFVLPSPEIHPASHCDPWAPWYCLPSHAENYGLLVQEQVL